MCMCRFGKVLGPVHAHVWEITWTCACFGSYLDMFICMIGKLPGHVCACLGSNLDMCMCMFGKLTSHLHVHGWDLSRHVHVHV